MAKKAPDTSAPSPSSLAESLLKNLIDNSTSTKAYVLGDHAKHTWGIPIPTLAFSWLIGGSSVLPLQRYFSFSGITKSFKSTLNIEIGCWFVGAYRRLSPEAKTLFDALSGRSDDVKLDPTDVAAGFSQDAVVETANLMTGLFIYLDTESKTSGSMLDAMTWWRLNDAQKKQLIYKEVESVEEWMLQATEVIKFAQNLPDAPKGQRVPILVSIDSLTGKTSEDVQEETMKEGGAKARSFPVLVMQITNFFKSISLMGTTMSMAYVRHLKKSMDPNEQGRNAMKESGGSEVAFKTSISIRVAKFGGYKFASHEAMPFPSISGEGYTLVLDTDLSCVGPDHRKINVDVLWQFVPMPDGTSRQVMLYDWNGALGQLLHHWKYAEAGKGRLYATDLERLATALHFVQGKSSKTIKCEELKLEDASFTAFGAAIEGNPEVRERISRFMNITQYPSVQVADIDRSLPKKKTEK